jgi:hypothetical protein
MDDSQTTSTEKTFLEDWELNVVLIIERHHSMSGAIPSDDAILELINTGQRAKRAEFKTISDLTQLKSNPLFKASLESRGIVVNYDPDKALRDVNTLTPRQMAAAAVMMNLADRRSNEKKLRDLGISTEEWANWLQNNQFSEYLRERSEVMISNSVHEAHLGLMRGVQQGNTASIKLYYELTGRYNPNEENQVNIRLVIGKVLEAIQKHIRDPETLNALAVEMSQIAIEAGTPPVAKSNIVSASTRKELS